MKIDMHTHCLPVSRCAHHMAELLPDMFREASIDAIVLTNHCSPYHCDVLGETHEKQALEYIDVYRRCKQRGESIGFKVFFGVEVKLINEPNLPEFLLYGISEEDFILHYPLYDKTQKELYDFCEQKNILMVQAHPFRIEQGHKPANIKYVHGIEVYNSHPSFDANFEQAFDLANKNNKIKTAGSDFHIKAQAGSAGMIVPDDIEDQFMLREYLKKCNFSIFSEKGVIEI